MSDKSSIFQQFGHWRLLQTVLTIFSLKMHVKNKMYIAKTARAMKQLNVPIDDLEYAKLGLTSDTISFRDLKEKLSIDYAKESLLQCNSIAADNGLSQLTLEDINAEINAVRDAKNRH